MDRMRERRREIRERDTRWLMSMDVKELNRTLFPLLVVLIVLNFADVVLTLEGIMAGPSFTEYNKIAAALFDKQFVGFMAALGLKYAMLVPMSFCALISDRPSRPVQIRMVKLAALVALVAANVFYAYVVGWDATNLVAFKLAYSSNPWPGPVFV